MELQVNQHIHTKELMKLAKNKEANSISLALSKPVDVQESKLLWLRDLLQLELMQEDGHIIHLVFSATVEKT